MKTSETIKEIAAALVEFQSKLTTVKKDGKNPHFGNKYASLSNIIEAIQAPLTECGISVIQLPVAESQLETILLHKSGEFISEIYTMRPVRNDPQGIGSAITYQRRYALGAILCLNIDEDDDGQAASQPAKKVEMKPKEKPVMPDDRFAKMCDTLRKSTQAEAGNC